MKAIIAFHNDEFLDIEFPNLSKYFSNDARNTKNSEVTSKDPSSFNVNITVGDKQKINAMLDLI